MEGESAMFGLPLHPALVHLPVGLGLIMPVLIGAALWAVASGRAGKGPWVGVILLQLLLFTAALVTSNTGETDAEIIKGAIDVVYIDAHEEAANWFVWMCALTTLLSMGALRKTSGTRGRNISMALTLLGSVAAASLVVWAASLGGELVYKHNAPAAHTDAAPR